MTLESRTIDTPNSFVDHTKCQTVESSIVSSNKHYRHKVDITDARLESKISNSHVLNYDLNACTYAWAAG